MNGFARFGVGLSGGLAAAASKVLALDIEQLARFVDQGNTVGLTELRVTIFVVTPILMFLGGMLAWASTEENRLKLLAIGCAAPAMIAPWTASAPRWAEAALNPAILSSPAYAGDTEQAVQSSSYLTGIKALFGVASPETRRYWVIVGSENDLQRAKKFADAINSVAPDMQAFVGRRQPDNEYYPIIVGGQDAYLPLKGARELLAKALKVPIVPRSAYLSNYPDRVPSPEG